MTRGAWLHKERCTRKRSISCTIARGASVESTARACNVAQATSSSPKTRIERYSPNRRAEGTSSSPAIVSLRDFSDIDSSKGSRWSLGRHCLACGSYCEGNDGIIHQYGGQFVPQCHIWRHELPMNELRWQKSPGDGILIYPNLVGKSSVKTLPAFSDGFPKRIFGHDA